LKIKDFRAFLLIAKKFFLFQQLKKNDLKSSICHQFVITFVITFLKDFSLTQ